MLCAARAEVLQVADVKPWPPCRSAHLTNDAVQINFDHYGSFEDANKLTMEALQELFAGQVGLAPAACLTPGLALTSHPALCRTLPAGSPLVKQHARTLSRTATLRALARGWT